MGLFAASVGVHALWNGLSISVLLLSLGVADVGSGAAAGALSSMGTLAVIVILISLAVAMSVVFWWVTRSLRRRGASEIVQPPAALGLRADPPQSIEQPVTVDASSLEDPSPDEDW
jgi:hypothetical protein